MKEINLSYGLEEIIDGLSEKHCEKCGAEHDGSYGSGRFCSKFCARSFSTSKNRKEISKKTSEKLRKEAEVSHIVNPFSYEGKISICERCFGYHDGLLGSGRFCSLSCANSKEYYSKPKVNSKPKVKNECICLRCNQRFFSNTKNKDYCSDACKFDTSVNAEGKFEKTCKVCGKIYYRRHFISSGYCSGKCNPKSGGYREGSVKSYKGGTYDGIKFDSSWELAYYIYCKDNNIQIERNRQGFSYFYDGKNRLYYPDFIINGDEYVEIKGYVQPETKIKLKSFPHKITLITREQLQPIFEYVTNKYGTSNYYLLYDSTDKPIFSFKCDYCGVEVKSTVKKTGKNRFCCNDHSMAFFKEHGRPRNKIGEPELINNGEEERYWRPGEIIPAGWRFGAKF